VGWRYRIGLQTLFLQRRGSTFLLFLPRLTVASYASCAYYAYHAC
jgi:hypothetical protein